MSAPPRRMAFEFEGPKKNQKRAEGPRPLRTRVAVLSRSDLFLPDWGFGTKYKRGLGSQAFAPLRPGLSDLAPVGASNGSKAEILQAPIGATDNSPA